jgi:membrane-bound ClpP family serine protease
MKHILTLLISMALGASLYASDSLTVFYRIRMDRDIDKAAQRMLVSGLEKADEAGADYVLLDQRRCR